MFLSEDLMYFFHYFQLLYIYDLLWYKSSIEDVYLQVVEIFLSPLLLNFNFIKLWWKCTILFSKNILRFCLLPNFCKIFELLKISIILNPEGFFGLFIYLFLVYESH